MTWNSETSCGYEAQKVKYLTVPYTRGVGLDIGCGSERVWPHAIGIDRFPSPDGASICGDIETLPFFADACMDWVFSSHALEDFPEGKTGQILAEWWRVIKPGGYLILYLPHEDHYPKIGEEGCNPAHERNLKPQDVKDAMPAGWCLIEDEVRSGGNEYSFFQVYRKGKKRVDPCWKSVSGKPVCLVTRYGGFGDMIQASSVFPALVEQGYEVHVNTTPRGWDIIKTDPNVSGSLIQDTDQVPNLQLDEFWAMLPERYDKVVNLSESVEEQLLARPGSKMHGMPHERRHFMLNRNYMEFTHAIAGVPDAAPAPRFFATPKEKKRARKRLVKYGGEYTLLWVLSGSSPHKRYPKIDTVIATLMRDNPGVNVILVGDTVCQLIERGWEAEPRVTLTAGKWSIRDTLALAEMVDCVVGPETGVLNAVSSLEDVAKVVFLSHSSPENLTKYWKNTITLEPQDLPCYPCHQMHYGKDYCPVDEDTNSPLCTVRISPQDVYNAIKEAIAT